MTVKVRVLCYLPGVFASCQPEVGKIYEASYEKRQVWKGKHYSPVCVIDVRGKKICLKRDEYEIVEE